MKKQLLEKIKNKFPEDVIKAEVVKGDSQIVVRRQKYFDIIKFLKEDSEYKMNHFIDLTCVDWLGQKERFEIVVHLRSQLLNHRIRIKTRLEEKKPTVSSLTPLYKGANWFEREAWDLYGIKFEGHPDLRRILLFEGFEGHPLRKDYPKTKMQSPIPLREDAPTQPLPFKERQNLS